MLLEGLFLPLTTPFYPDGRLNLRKLEHNVDRASKTPVAGLVVLSEPGEAAMLSDEETKEALSAAIAVAVETKVMLAGVSRSSVVATLELADVAAGLGYDAVLVKRPSILTAEAASETLTYFRTVADRAAAPVVLYSTKCGPLAVELVAELAGHPQVLGLMDEAADASRVAAIVKATSGVKREVTVTHVFTAVTGRMQVAKAEAGAATFVSAETLTEGRAAVAVAPPKPAIKTRSKTVGFQVLAANTAAMLAGLKAGASGVMPAFAAAAPQACYEVYAAWKDGDLPLAEEKQQHLAAAVAGIEEALGVPGIRYASDLNGYFGGAPRLPLLPLTGAERQAVERLMGGIRN
ncbi:dihydrodipicolinate synthase family protein [Edaphobacter bradus]|uniref:dihydrodipicolinate synthase family protein n=1 Tax=Edaphobacter bradus TaxID=2259016 RepID=UPI0021DF8C2F|nr:dihydrodipicolinate synthase family protein [Edaphobacter bradus]